MEDFGFEFDRDAIGHLAEEVGLFDDDRLLAELRRRGERPARSVHRHGADFGGGDVAGDEFFGEGLGVDDLRRLDGHIE